MERNPFPLSSPEELIKTFGGSHPISKVLIANNGLAAVKFIRSVRTWAYEAFGNEHMIKFIAMASPDDIAANAEFIKIADHFVPVPSGTNNNNYANVDLIVELAKRTEAQAVWAGWGHASENPMLPDKLTEAGIIFIGPPGNSMRLLGDKISSTIVAQSAQVPTIQWSGTGLTLRIPEDVNVSADGKMELPSDVYLKACVTNVEDGLKACKEIGYPVMIKASEGGGGKGIRKVNIEKDFTHLFEQVKGEVPGSPIFIMRLAENVRHLEVQLLGDNYGNIISVFSRDCSVQRRHQKVFEEAPVTIAPQDVITAMEEAAVRLGKLVGYRSVGTVEYLFSPETNQFCFLELNPRLQVEHPCTELVADVNLPACQLLVAMGVPLSNIPEIRHLYGKPIFENENIDFPNTKTIRPRGHVIAARITAENADEGFKPGGGRLFELTFKSNKNVWGYFSVGSAGNLHEFADSQFGHIFAWGENREKARLNLIMALKDIVVRGEFQTPVEYLIKLLEHSEFKHNQIHTKWLDNFIEKKFRVDRPPIFDSLICGAIHVASKKISANMQEIKTAFERGHIVGLTIGGAVIVDLISEGIKYFVSVTKSGPCQYTLTMNGTTVEARCHGLNDGGTLISIGARSFATYMKEEPDKYCVQIDSHTAIFEKESDPSQLRTTSPGKLIRYLVEEGEHIEAGDAYAEVEVMKMVMTLHSSEAGIIYPSKSAGSVLENGDHLARLVLDDPSKVRKITLFDGGFPAMDDPVASTGKEPHQVFQHALEAIKNILEGFRIPEATQKQAIKKHVQNIRTCVADPHLPLYQVQQCLSSMAGRIPQSLETNIKGLLNEYQQAISSLYSAFPAPQIQKLITECADDFLSASKKLEADQFDSRVQSLKHLVQQYSHGTKVYGREILASLLRQYLAVESLFQGATQTASELKVLIDLREKHRDQKDSVFSIVWAHWNDVLRTEVILDLLDWLGAEPNWTPEERSILDQVAELQNPRNAAVALSARKLLIQSHLRTDTPIVDEAVLAKELELNRLSGYTYTTVPGGNFRQHVYYAKSKENQQDKRFFVRCLLTETDMVDSHPEHAGGAADLFPIWNYQAEKLLVESLATLEIVRNDPQYGATDCNHICMNSLPILDCDLDTVTNGTAAMLRKHGDKIFKLRITDGEVIAKLRIPGTDRVDRYRWVLQNQTGFFQKGVASGATIRVWKEEVNAETGAITLVAVDMPDSSERVPLVDYQPSNNIHFKRHFAQIRGTSYVHDIPATFHKSLTRAWSKFVKPGQEPKILMKVKELFLDDKGELVEGEPQPGKNTVAMVAWRMTLFTPEFPQGREIFVLANDITIDIGSFAVGEDELFFKVSELARKLRLPRIYISVNSGARIGLADEVKSKFKIAWKNPNDPAKGFNYLYLSEADYNALNIQKKVVICEKLEVDDEVRYVITDVIGEKEFGVENLRGSGLIAGETSRAYNETFTLSLVTCRTVGIGAYLVRLGQRVIQVDSSTIILTGCEALNKLLGRNVYTNNHQLGGPMIMFNNGVSHLTVPTDLAGVEAIVHWLSYIPKSGFDSIPIMPSDDSIERDIEFEPTALPYDPRWMIAGKEEDGKFIKGFFDTGSWTETMSGWAKNVVVGRARLGGLPIGVICVETRSTEMNIPADPALPDSQAEIFNQAGQVWFPNSSFKTAQAIKDFNQEKLPLIIFANWRGFSGGTRDMFNEILKYGAYIVDNLVGYNQPVFVYIPPHAELRGGAWVVVDPTINSDMMEMYADKLSRGGILEPDGTVSVKFRKPDLIKAMTRLDPEYSKLSVEFNAPNTTADAKAEIKGKLIERERYLLPLYHQAALTFADLHDTPGRMKEKNTIHDILEWKRARNFFAWRVHRRVLEEEVVKKVREADPSLSHKNALEKLHSWFPVDWNNDQEVTHALRTEKFGEQLAKELTSLKLKVGNVDVNALVHLVNQLSEEQKQALLAQIKK